MVHSKYLRVIGQSLEAAKIPSFELEADGPNYVVKSELLTGTGEWVLRHAISRNDFSEQTARQSTVKRSVRFTPGNISRLEDPTGSHIYIYTFLINTFHRQFRNTDRHNTRNSQSSIPFKKSNPSTHPSLVLRHCVATLSTGALAKTYDCAGMTRPKFSSLYWNCGGS
jgi:hypothetical protein